MEDTYNGELDCEMTEQHLLGARPLFTCSWDLCRLELPLSKVWCSVDDDPWDRTAKVDHL